MMGFLFFGLGLFWIEGRHFILPFVITAGYSRVVRACVHVGRALVAFLFLIRSAFSYIPRMWFYF